jgi:hypothetical protein
MSTDQDKFNHSRRLQKDENAVRKQTKIAKQHGSNVKEPHRFVKHHAMDCGHPGCYMCGNPRRTMNEKTIQEQRFEQIEKDIVDPNS